MKYIIANIAVNSISLGDAFFICIWLRYTNWIFSDRQLENILKNKIDVVKLSLRIAIFQ